MKQVIKKKLWVVLDRNGRLAVWVHGDKYKTPHIYLTKKDAQRFAYSGRYVKSIQVNL